MLLLLPSTSWQHVSVKILYFSCSGRCKVSTARANGTQENSVVGPSPPVVSESATSTAGGPRVVLSDYVSHAAAMYVSLTAAM